MESAAPVAATSAPPRKRRTPRKRVPSDQDLRIQMILAKADKRQAFLDFQAEVGLNAGDVLKGLKDALALAANAKELLAVWKEIARLTGAQPRLGPCSVVTALKRPPKVYGPSRKPAWRPPEKPKHPWRPATDQATPSSQSGCV